MQPPSYSRYTWQPFANMMQPYYEDAISCPLHLLWDRAKYLHVNSTYNSPTISGQAFMMVPIVSEKMAVLFIPISILQMVDESFIWIIAILFPTKRMSVIPSKGVTDSESVPTSFFYSMKCNIPLPLAGYWYIFPRRITSRCGIS